MAGLPLIAGTVTGLLLLTQPSEVIRAIGVATLACVPATILHLLVFSAMARRHGPAACSAAANITFALAAAALGLLVTDVSLALPAAVAAVVAGGVWLGRQSSEKPTAVPGPRSQGSRADDLPWRVGAAVLLAALLLVASERAPAAVGGWLLALPIVGNVLPVFTLRRDGVAATQALLRGFVSGFGAFVGFFALLVIGLPLVETAIPAFAGPSALLVFGAAVLGAPIIGAALAWVVRRIAG